MKKVTNGEIGRRRRGSLKLGIFTATSFWNITETAAVITETAAFLAICDVKYF